MDFSTTLSAVVLVTFVLYVVIRGALRLLLRRRQHQELVQARQRNSTPETIRKLEARHAFQRGENTQGVMLLTRDKTDT